MLFGMAHRALKRINTSIKYNRCFSITSTSIQIQLNNINQLLLQHSNQYYNIGDNIGEQEHEHEPTVSVPVPVSDVEYDALVKEKICIQILKLLYYQ